VDQTQRDFLVDLQELVEHIFADLDELRATKTDGRSRRELIDRIFRRVHSVKGSAASCALDVVSLIAHEFENLLDEVRSGRVLINDDLIDTCESAADALSESLSLEASGSIEPARSDLFERLRAARKTSEPQGHTKTILKSIPFEIWESLSEHEKHRLVNVVAGGSPVFVIDTSFDIADFDSQFFQLQEKLAKVGEVISTAPAVSDEHPDRINFRVLYASDAKPQALEAAVVGFSNATFNEIASAAGGDEEISPASSLPASLSLSNFVRTDLDKLDQLISSAHELLRKTSNALHVAIAQPLTEPARAELQELNEQIRSSFMDVEDQLINLRLVTVGPALQRAMRAGRAAARLASKEVDFEIGGADIRLDKLLVEAIADPLLHLVRNAVDHGIETAGERAQAGKKEHGTIRIEAVNEGSQSRLRVTDDGRGVDPVLISEAALRLGILQTSDEGLDIERSLRMIFRPGFTTLPSLSDLSGRGVGLDVVETAIEQVGGELRVSSEFGGGTTFEVRLPVTFGLLAATLFVSGGNRYCIPASQVLAVDTPDSTNTAPIDFTLVSMRKLLGQPQEEQITEESRQQLRVITCEFPNESSDTNSDATRCVGLLVDAAEPTEEVLVRHLGRHSGRWHSVAGAAELRDGTVALVLDLPRLLAGQ